MNTPSVPARIVLICVGMALTLYLGYFAPAPHFTSHRHLSQPPIRSLIAREFHK